MTEMLARPLTWLLSQCCALLGNPIAAIGVFTLLTKVILLPISLWVQRNSIKMVEIMPQLNRLKLDYYGDKNTIVEKQQELYKQEGYHPLLSSIPMIIQIVLLMGVIEAVKNVLGTSESVLILIPAQALGVTLFVPLLAGLAALALALAQSKISPLQREQSVAEQVMTGGVSVAISLVLGCYVTVGVGIYWIAGNLISILQQLVLNIIIRPAKYIDYAALAKSREGLVEIEDMGDKKRDKSLKQREKVDYKRFFSVANKHLVFYSEKSGFYKYFQNVIEYLLTHSNIIIHYVTSDPNDQVFRLAETHPRIRPYYIGEQKLITLMMKMDADMVVMTTPDLNNLYLKRSYVRNDIEYIYMFHGVASTNLVVRKGAYDHFDTVFCVGQHQIDELREAEKMYNLPAKNLVACGYGLFDQLIDAYTTYEKPKNRKQKILIAPSWQEGNILDNCLDAMLPQLLAGGYSVTVRPHPEYIKRYPGKINSLLARYQKQLNEDFAIEKDFSSNTTIFTADLVITDWSGIAYEFSYCTLRPCIFINTPMKVLNPDYIKYQNIPLDISLRSQVGISLNVQDVTGICGIIDTMLCQSEDFKQQIELVRQKYLFHVGESGHIGGQYILNRLKKS